MGRSSCAPCPFLYSDANRSVFSWESIFVWPFVLDRRRTRESSQKRKNTAIWALVLTTERRYIKYSFVHYLDYECK